MLRFFRGNKKTEELTIDISTNTLLKVLLMIIGSILLLVALRKTTHALVLIFTAFFLALALNGPVHWVSVHLPGKKRGSRSLATSLSFVIVILVLGVFISSLVPPLVRQTKSFINAAPNLVHNVRNQNGEVGKFVRKYHLEKQLDTFSSQLSNRLKNIGGTAFSSAKRVGSSVFAVLTILVLTFMMLVEGPMWSKLVLEVVPPNRRDDARRLSQEMYRVIRGFVNGQVLLAVIASVLIAPALFALHISYPVALMVIVFICGLIPLVGHTIGAIIVTFVALFHSPTSAIIILTYYILYQQIENYFIQPRIQANNTNISPLVVLTSVIIGVSFSGLLGGLVAIPVAGCLRILVLEYLRDSHSLSTREVDQAIDDAK
ncbi:MAG TPA: AI-2E family transporter [Candidatus Saccharimonadales bacterium]|nr:AI-2E family transporter [Candidatus Saccharimonadales bacterium]